jgi:methyl-accepting chemotaxis protein
LKYWAAHQKEMTGVSALIEQLDKLLGASSPAHPLVAQLRSKIPQAQNSYLAAFEAYKASDNNFVHGDAAAKGKHRQAACTLAELRAVLSKAELSASEAAALGAKSATTIVVTVMLLVTVVSIGCSILLSSQIVASLQQAVLLADQVAHGDLTAGTNPQGEDGVADFLRSLHAIQTSLITLVATVRHGSEDVANTSTEIAQGNHDLSSRTEQQASALEETASSMEELGSAVSQSAGNARQASLLANNARTLQYVVEMSWDRS